MSYVVRFRPVGVLGTPAVTSLTSVADSAYKKVLSAQMQGQTLTAMVTTAVVSSAPVVLSYYKCPTADSGGSGARILIGTIAIPGGATVGQVYVKNIEENPLLVPGDFIVCSVTTAAAGGGAAGNAYWDIDLADSPDSFGNQVNVVKSA